MPVLMNMFRITTVLAGIQVSGVQMSGTQVNFMFRTPNRPSSGMLDLPFNVRSTYIWVPPVFPFRRYFFLFLKK